MASKLNTFYIRGRHVDIFNIQNQSMFMTRGLISARSQHLCLHEYDYVMHVVTVYMYETHICDGIGWFYRCHINIYHTKNCLHLPARLLKEEMHFY